MLKDKERCENVIFNVYQKYYPLYDGFYLETHNHCNMYDIILHNNKGNDTYFEVDTNKFKQYRDMYKYIEKIVKEYIRECLKSSY